MVIVDKQRRADRGQCHLGGVEERVRGGVVLRTNPFALQHSPKRLCDIQMRRVWRQIEEVESTTLPYGSHLLYGATPVDTCVVKHDDNVPCLLSERHPVKEVRHLVGGHALTRGETFVFVVSRCHAENVEPCNLLGRDKDVLVPELPPVGHVSFGADVAFIGVVEVYLPVFGLPFKFLQLLDLVFVELRRGLSPWAFSYTLISCANAAKKRLNVDSLASLPLACCHASRALFTLCRSCSIASLTAFSSEQSIIGLRPLPGRVVRPLTPSSLYRLNHLFTVCCSISVLSPTFAADMPSAFNSTARHRILKQCLSPKRYPLSSSDRCASDNSKRSVLLISYVYFTQITRIAA